MATPDGPQQGPTARRRRRWPKVLALTLAILVLALITLGAGAVFLLNRLVGNVQTVDAQTAERPESHEAVNLLLMGSDSRSGPENRGYGRDSGRGGERSDTTILLHVSADRSRALAVSIPRDTYVKMPPCAGGEFAKFNHAFEAGGASCTVELVKQMSGVPIHHLAVVDFGGFKNVIDTMGGVEVCVTRPIDDPQSKLSLPAGKSVVNGEQALGFVRARKTLGDGSDIGRIKRQQAFLSAAIREATSKGLLLNPVKLYQVLEAASKSLSVDAGLNELAEMNDFAGSIRGLSPRNITFVTMPFLWRNDSNVDMDPTKARELWNAIESDTPWPPPVSKGPDGKAVTIPADQIQVAVVNATGRQREGKLAEHQLAKLGFQVSDATLAKPVEKTVVLYPANLADSARTVAFAAGGAQMVLDPTADVITLRMGSDWHGAVANIVVAKPKGTTDPATEPSTADQVVCAE